METEQEVREPITDALQDHMGEGGEAFPQLTPFAEAGIFTNNEGLVLRFPSGPEFQITIVRSR